MNVIKVSVKTVSVERRCRAGLCFSASATVVEVDEAQLQALQADGYLQVDVLADDTTTKQTGEEAQLHSRDDNAKSGVGDVSSELPKDEATKDEATKGDGLAQQLADAIRNSDIDVTANKVPTVTDVKQLVDFDVNASLRDAAWALVTAE